MTRLLSTGLGKRFALLGALVVLAMGLIASTAFAEVKLSPEGTYSGALGGQKQTAVTVSGTPPAAFSTATHVAISTCDVSVPAEIGKRCDKAASSGETLRTVAEYEAGIGIKVRKGPWQAFDYTMGTPPIEGTGKVTCKGSGTGTVQCGIVVSYYKVEGAVVKQLGAELKEISFS